MVMSVCNGQQARDRLPDLWRAIEDAHYVYLETDDSPDKIRLRKKLEGFITEYLSLVPHEYKFALPETAKAFQRTITDTDFSAYRAGQGWAALARYAENLLTQPWRKEYRTIRLYCGYYKHEVEANIVGGEALLIAMGYKTAGAGRLVLAEPPCPDTLAGVARDALLANTECNIMCEMWECAWESGARVSWRDVCWVRASSVGDRAAAAKMLLRSSAAPHTADRGIYANVPATSNTHHLPIRPQRYPTNGTSNNRLYDHSPTEEPLPPIQANYITQPTVIPNVYPLPMYNALAPQCNQIPIMTSYTPYCYPIPVQNPYMVQTPVYVPVKQATNVPINGYLPHYRPTVPTAQLIELENSCDRRLRREDERIHKRTSRNVLESNRNVLESSRCTSKSGFSEMSIPSIARSDTQPALSKAREDGMGTYESWDYVFRNLSSKEQERDNRSRVSPSLDRDSRTLDRLEREERRFKYQPTTMDLEDGMQALNIDRTYDDDLYRTAKVNENLMRLKQEEELKRASKLAKKHAEEKRLVEEKRFIEEKRSIENKRRSAEVIGHPSSADALTPPRISPDKLRLLSKQDVKDRKVENSCNGSAADLKKVKKPLKPIEVAGDKTRSKPVTNGHHSGGSSSKNITAPPLSTQHPPAQNQPPPSNNYDTKTHLIVALDETDSIHPYHPPNRTLNGDRTSQITKKPEDSKKKEEIKKKEDKWVCSTCTYINPTDLKVCEMCGKSKQIGSEVEPLTSGGRECPICTLVNSKQARVCDACGAKLNDCPTYI